MTRASDAEWTVRAKNLLKSELKRRGFSYAELSAELARLGIAESETNIANKLSRGTFSATFLLQCLKAIGANRIDISE